MSEPMNVLVFGAGAIGTYIGGSLALAGHHLVFIEQPKVVEELRQRGLRLDLTIDKRRKVEGASVVNPSSFVCVSSLVEAFQFGPFDIAIFVLKSFDTASALEAMKPHADKLPPILCLQNGVDNELVIAAALGDQSVIAGTVTSSIGRLAAGDIVVEKSRGVGVAAGHALSERLVAALEAAGLRAHLYPRPADMKWSKLLANLPGSAIAAIMDMTPAEVFSHAGLYDLEMRMMREALVVMKALGIRVINLPKTPVTALAFATRLPSAIARPLLKKVIGGGRGGKRPSFHIDLHAGRKQSEVDWLQGAVVRYGEKCRIPTPVNRVLVQTLLAMVRGEIPIEAFSHQPEKLINLIEGE